MNPSLLTKEMIHYIIKGLARKFILHCPLYASERLIERALNIFADRTVGVRIVVNRKSSSLFCTAL